MYFLTSTIVSFWLSDQPPQLAHYISGLRSSKWPGENFIIIFNRIIASSCRNSHPFGIKTFRSAEHKRVGTGNKILASGITGVT